MKLLYVVSHPIQYQAPLLRKVAIVAGINLRVIFRTATAEGYYDVGFRQNVVWDTPLTEGYDHVYLNQTDLGAEIAAADAVWIHGWQGRLENAALHLSSLYGKPVLMRGENNDVSMPDGGGLRGWVKRQRLARIFSACSAFLAIGSENRDYYLKRGIPDHRIFMTPYAIDNEWFSTAAAAARPNRDQLRREFKIDNEKPIILFAGKLMARKHPEDVIEAVSATWSEQDRPNLLFVGDGELRTDLEYKAPWARFVGFKNQSELPGIYDLADVFVLPSEREPWGLAVNEAMACGTAAVVSDEVGAARDLVVPSNGGIFKLGDIPGLGNTLRDVLSSARSKGAAAQKRIRSWSFDDDIDGLTTALDAVNNTPTPARTDA